MNVENIGAQECACYDGWKAGFQELADAFYKVGCTVGEACKVFFSIKWDTDYIYWYTFVCDPKLKNYYEHSRKKRVRNKYANRIANEYDRFKKRRKG